MTSRISPEALQRLLATLPAEAQEPFPHLASLNPDQLLLRRVQLGQQLKALEEERKFIDSELQTIYSIAELRHGVRVAGGWLAQQRSRTSWNYEPEVKDAIKSIQKQAQNNGQAEELISSYLCFTRVD